MAKTIIRKEVLLTDPNYFCNKSFTLSFNMNTMTWISFHSYIPNFYVGENNFYYSAKIGCCDDFDFIVGVPVRDTECYLDSATAFVTQGPQPDCRLTAVSIDVQPTTSTTTTIPLDCIFEATAYVAVPPVCYRPDGLNQYWVISGYTHNGVPTDSTGSLEDACNAISYANSIGLYEDFTLTQLPVEAFAFIDGNLVYLNHNQEDCECLADGWYFTEDSMSTNTIYHIVDCEIVQTIDNCLTTTTSTTTSAPICLLEGYAVLEEGPAACNYNGGSAVVLHYGTTTTSTSTTSTSTSTTSTTSTSTSTTTSTTTLCPTEDGCGVEATITGVDLTTTSTTTTPPPTTTTTSTTAVPTTTTSTTTATPTTTTTSTTIPPTTTTTTTFADTELLVNLTSVWEMNESSGNIADSHGSNNSITNLGNTYQNTAPTNLIYATGGNGSNSYFRIPQASALNPQQVDFSVNIWVKYTGADLSTDIDFLIASGLYNSVSNGEWSLVLRGGATYKGVYLRLRTQTPAELVEVAPTIDQTSNIDDDGWHMITVTLSRGDTELVLYLDGAEIGSTTNAFLSDIDIDPVIEDLAIGANATFNNFHLNGEIAQLGIWNKTLSLTDIALLYGLGNGLAYINWGSTTTTTTTVAPTTTTTTTVEPTTTTTTTITTSAPNSLNTNKVRVWELDETSGLTAFDSVGSENLTLGSGVTVNQAGPTNLKSMAFDGTNDGKAMSGINAVPNSATATYAFWFKSSQTGGAQERTLLSIEGGWFSFLHPTSTTGVTASFSGSSSGVTNLGDYADGDWHHLLASNNGTTTTVYIDGVQEASYANTNYDLSGLNRATGVAAKWDGTRTILGNMSQVAVWSDAKGLTEAQALYNSGNGLAYINW